MPEVPSKTHLDARADQTLAAHSEMFDLLASDVVKEVTSKL
jgi:hypothetical protein